MRHLDMGRRRDCESGATQDILDGADARLPVCLAPLGADGPDVRVLDATKRRQSPLVQVGRAVRQHPHADPLNVPLHYRAEAPGRLISFEADFSSKVLIFLDFRLIVSGPFEELRKARSM